MHRADRGLGVRNHVTHLFVIFNWPQDIRSNRRRIHATRVVPPAHRASPSKPAAATSRLPSTPRRAAFPFRAREMRPRGRLQRNDRKFQPRSFAPAEPERCGHRIRRGPNHRPQRIRNGEANAMARAEKPNSSHASRWEASICDWARDRWDRGGLALRATLPCAGDQRRGAVRRDVGEPHEPIRQRRAR